MKPPLRTRRARGTAVKTGGKAHTPAHRFYRFGKHYRAGLQAPERVPIVRNQGGEVSGQSAGPNTGGHSAKSVSDDERHSLAGTGKRQAQLSRRPVDFIHEGGGWLAKEPFIETPNSKQPGYPIRLAGSAPPLARLPLAHYDG